MTTPLALRMTDVAGLLGSIRGRLVVGLVILVALLTIAVAYGRSSMTDMSAVIGRTLAEVQEEARLSSALSATIAQEIESAAHYLETRDMSAQAAFRRLGLAAHRIQREMNGLPGQTAAEVALVASIDSKLSDLENHYARAHRLADLGRMQPALREAQRTREITDALLADIAQLGQLKARKMAAASRQLTEEAARRSWLLVFFVVLALLAGSTVIGWVIYSIARHLRHLVQHAKELSQGNLTVRTTGDMPGEFEVLARALNHTGESLATVVSVVAKTADDVADAAQDLASVSEQIALSANQMASAMSEVTAGAETQVSELRSIDAALQSLRQRAGGVRDGAAEVNSLASAIERAAAEKRSEVERALAILMDVRATVQSAAAEVVALNDTTADITRFVGTVSRIAEQTNLLALNAAIEAARAGQAGRGFAVVADEVRKLAEQAQTAADEIVQMTGMVTARVSRTSTAMESGVSRVGEIERVSREIDDALTIISSAAERTRLAATTVSTAAEENEAVLVGAATGIASIARTAEGHAATAEEVSASTEEQSAACEQMNSASTHLTDGSTLLRELVKGLRTGTT